MEAFLNIDYAPETELLRGEFIGLKISADFFDDNIPQLIEADSKSLKKPMEFNLPVLVKEGNIAIVEHGIAMLRPLSTKRYHLNLIAKKAYMA